METDLQQFAKDLQQEVLSEAHLEGAEMLKSEAFTLRMVQELTEAGELDDANLAYYRARGVEVSGYAISEDGRRLDLLTTIHTQQVPPPTVTKDRVDTAVKRLLTFLERARRDLVHTVEESTPAFDMAVAIKHLHPLEKVRLFVVTDGRSTVKSLPAQHINGHEVSVHIWDINRLHKSVTSGQQQESIDIDFVDRYGEPVLCLVVPQNWADYSAHLAIVPGVVLAQIYDEYGPRLLERNVRAFLQSRGKVNQGIKHTILNEPERFFAYNNGITATASRVKLVDLPNGGKGIASVHDLQIVNGGQTTASIHSAVKRDKADLSHIFVPAKLTIVPPKKLNEIVPLISRYANSQNKVNEADFEANSPFHVKIEHWSRTVWAPAVGDSQQQTRWFYERARGQYQDALGRQTTPAQKRKFKAVHPTKQKFTKTDLAKFENSWDQFPHIVSLGAQKNFRHYTLRLAQRGKFAVTQAYFERLVAKAIVFRRAERIVSQQQFGGYRANIVTYTIAYISNATGQRVDLDAIWRAQDISPALADTIETSCYEVRKALINAPGSGNVTEWCKKVACWHLVRDLSIPIPRSLKRELSAPPAEAWRLTEMVSEVLSQSPQPLGKRDIIAKSGIPEDAWYPTIRSLLAQGIVVQQGDRRGAKYSFAET